MTAAVGFPTLRLVRVRIGNIHLQNMQAGAVKEVATFFSFVNKSPLFTNKISLFKISYNFLTLVK